MWHLKAYSHSYRCSKCEHSLWKYLAWLQRHEMTCEAGVRHVYNGGVYHTTPSVFQRLYGEGITVVDTLRFYPYRATFDFECFFDGENLPADSDRVQWIARHVPLSVSLASNVCLSIATKCFHHDRSLTRTRYVVLRGMAVSVRQSRHTQLASRRTADLFRRWQAQHRGARRFHGRNRRARAEPHQEKKPTL